MTLWRNKMLTAMGDVMREAYKRNWITTRDGNISLKRKNSNILYITPSGVRKTIIHPESIVKMKIVEGSTIQCDLSLTLLFNYKTTLGIANRLDSAVCLLAGFQLSDSFFLGLSYDYMTNELRSFNSGSYEIILKFRLFSDDGKILTPRFF